MIKHKQLDKIYNLSYILNQQLGLQINVYPCNNLWSVLGNEIALTHYQLIESLSSLIGLII
jgi:hypothetical protein